MVYPVWLYRKHPIEGYFQATLCANESAHVELDSDWSEEPASTGFRTRPATHMHTSHIVDGLPLHEVVADATGNPTTASIDITLQGDIHG